MLIEIERVLRITEKLAAVDEAGDLALGPLEQFEPGQESNQDARCEREAKSILVDCVGREEFREENLVWRC